MKIKKIRDTTVYDGSFLEVIERKFRGRGGKAGIWEIVKRKIHGSIVAIAAITPESELILEKIYRIPCECYVLELPAGLSDVPGESEEDTVRRELLEETGYRVERLEWLTRSPFNAGLSKDEISIYLGMNARKIQKPILEAAEDITIKKIPLAKLEDFLTAKRKEKMDIKIASLVPFLRKRGLM